MENMIHESQLPVNLMSIQSDPSEECCLTEEVTLHNSDDLSSKRNKYTICLTRGFRVQCILRSILMLFCIMSIGCLCGSGTKEAGILELPLTELIRFHIFSTIFTFLTSAALLAVLSTIIDMLPINWSVFDAGTHFVTGLLCAISSSLLVYLEIMYKKQYTWVTEWTRSLIVIAAAFGYCTSAVCILLTLQHLCIGDVRLMNDKGEGSEDIMMGSIVSR